VSPKRTTAGYYVVEIDWSAKLGITINRSSECSTLRDHRAFVSALWRLRENGQMAVLRAFADGRIPAASIKQAARNGKLSSDHLLTEMALDRRLWHDDAICPHRDNGGAHKGDEPCLGAVDIALRSMGRSKETRRRYYTSLTKLRRLGAEWLGEDATVRSLTTVPWRELRERWTVEVKRRKQPGKGKAARKAGYVIESHEASAADWNHLARAISRFLTEALGDVYHPVRREIVKAIEREQEVERRPKIRGLFWEIIDRVPEHARPCYVILGATGMRVGEYLSCRDPEKCLRPDDHAIDVPGGKTGAKAYFVDSEYWDWVTLGIPSPLKYHWMRIYFKRAVAELGRPTLRLHDLRHLFAQSAKKEGVPTADTQAALGQRTPGITRGYEMEEVQADVARAVGRALKRGRSA
jgi:Phage integrase family.